MVCIVGIIEELIYIDWLICFNIVIGIVWGFVYLYDEINFCIIYRDIKVSNIFFDGYFEVKIFDFGFVKFCLDEWMYLIMVIVGIL